MKNLIVNNPIASVIVAFTIGVAASTWVKNIFSSPKTIKIEHKL